MTEYSAVTRLTRLAEINLCSKCYSAYLTLLEPAIRSLLAAPLAHWTETEAHITQMAMKHQGVFRDESILGVYLSRGEKPEEWIRNGVDIRAYWDIEHWGFEKKLKYLRKHGVLGDASFSLLNTARDLRNNIHDPTYSFSDKDYYLFERANHISQSIWWLYQDKNSRPEFWERFKPEIEKQASAMLSRYNDWEK